MRIILTTFDGHRNLLEANKYTMLQHGGAFLDVTVLGFKRPDFDLGSWRFVSMGEYKTPNTFSNDIAPFFEDFTDEYFILGNDDTVMTNQFNYQFLDEIMSVVRDMPNFGRMWLTGGSRGAYGPDQVVRDFGDYQIAEIGQGAKYRLSLQYSLWKTSYFKTYLTPDLSPWDWELRDTAKNDGYAILMPVGNFVVSIGHIMKKGRMLPNWNKAIYKDGELTEEEIVTCKEIFKKHGYTNN